MILEEVDNKLLNNVLDVEYRWNKLLDVQNVKIHIIKNVLK